MPQLQVIDTTPTPRAPTTLENILSSAAQEYNKVSNARRESDALGAIYKRYQEEGQTLEKTIMDIQKDPLLSPTTRVNTANQMLQLHKTNAALQKETLAKYKETEKRNNEKQSVYEMYKPHYGEKEAARRAEFDTPQAAAQNIKALTKKDTVDKADEAFDVSRAKAGSKEITKLEESIPKARDAIKNLDRITEISGSYWSGTAGPGGYVKTLLNTESAAELRSLGLTAIEPILKMFNPVGAIPTQKIKLIQEQFQPNPGDTQSTIQGKVNSLKRIANQGLARAEQRLALLEKHKGRPPAGELVKFDRDSEQLLDAISDQESFNTKIAGLKDTDTVSGLFSSDGRALKPIPKKEAQELFDKGLISTIPK